MRAWRLHEYGEPTEVLRIEEVPVPEAGTGEVLVRNEGIPLNLNDLERINGRNMMVRPELPYSPGMEVMGTVVAAGPGGEAQIGRRVAAMARQAYGGWAEYTICPAATAFDIPSLIPLPDAAALFFPYHLAWLGLFDRASLQAGETVLIHAAAGGSGSAAIQLAKHAGATIFATCGSAEKAAFCRGLGADVVIDYTVDDFATVVLDATGGRGVDVVFDNVGEAVLEGSLKAVAYNGRYVMMGFASDKDVADEPFLVPRRLMLSNVKLCGVMLAYAEAPMVSMLKGAMGWNIPTVELGAAIMRQIVELVEAGTIRPTISRTIAFEELPGAMAAMARRETMARVVAVL